MDQLMAAAQRPGTLLMALLVVGAVALAAGAQGHHEEAHEEAPEDAETFFHTYISESIIQTRCINCHVVGGLSGHTRLVFVPSDDPGHVEHNLQTFVDFLGEPEAGHDHGYDHEPGLEHGPERILTKIQGVSHGGGVQVPAGSEDFHNMDRFIALLEGHEHGFIERLLQALSEATVPMMLEIITPAEDDHVAGTAVAVSAALYVWDTLLDMDGSYELAAMYTEDGADSVVSHAVQVRVGNAAPADELDIIENVGSKTQMLSVSGDNDIVTADGVMVTVPAGALASDDRITITVVEPPDAAAAPGEAVGTHVSTVLASGQTIFDEPVTLALPYPEGKPDGLVDGTDPPIAETDLSLWYLDSVTDEWVAIADSMPMPADDLVVADVMHTGQFGVFHAPAAGADEDVPGGGGCAAIPMTPGGPSDPTLMALVGVAALYLVLRRRQLVRPAAAA